MKKPETIAIDGPASSGKSSIAQQLAERLNYVFVDTGAFYRAITYVVLKAEIALDKQATIAEMTEKLKLTVKPDSEYGNRLIADGQDITEQLRSKAVEASVSAIARMPAVRKALLPLQRSVASQGKVILAGRDIGTVVLPDADLKLYIDASPEERARRRYEQNREKGGQVTLEETRKALEQRDKADSERSHAPLTRSEDAIYILTDAMTLDEVVEYIVKIIEE